MAQVTNATRPPPHPSTPRSQYNGLRAPSAPNATKRHGGLLRRLGPTSGDDQFCWAFRAGGQSPRPCMARCATICPTRAAKTRAHETTSPREALVGSGCHRTRANNVRYMAANSPAVDLHVTGRWGRPMLIRESCVCMNPGFACKLPGKRSAQVWLRSGAVGRTLGRLTTEEAVQVGRATGARQRLPRDPAWPTTDTECPKNDAHASGRGAASGATCNNGPKGLDACAGDVLRHNRCATCVRPSLRRPPMHRRAQLCKGRRCPPSGPLRMPLETPAAGERQGFPIIAPQRLPVSRRCRTHTERRRESYSR